MCVHFFIRLKNWLQGVVEYVLNYDNVLCHAMMLRKAWTSIFNVKMLSNVQWYCLHVGLRCTLSGVWSKPLTSGRLSSSDGSSVRSRHGTTTSLSSSGCSGAQRYMVASSRVMSSGGDDGIAARMWSVDSRPSTGSWARLSWQSSRPITSAPNQSGSTITSSSLSFLIYTTWRTHTRFCVINTAWFHRQDTSICSVDKSRVLESSIVQ